MVLIVQFCETDAEIGIDVLAEAANAFPEPASSNATSDTFKVDFLNIILPLNICSDYRSPSLLTLYVDEPIAIEILVREIEHMNG